MCVNDLVVQGAEPLFFLDYFATGKLDVGSRPRIVAGIAEGCRQAGCALVGGETAEMPGMYAAGDYDLAGFAVGAVERDQVIDGSQRARGRRDPRPRLGRGSFQRLFAGAQDRRGRRPRLRRSGAFRPGRQLGEALLTPTRIYVKSCLAAARSGEVKALAHITGGGLFENIPRVLPDGLGGRNRCQALAPPAGLRLAVAQRAASPMPRWPAPSIAASA